MELQESQTLNRQIEMFPDGITSNSNQPEVMTSTSAFGTEHIDALLSDFSAVEVEKEIEKRIASLMNKEEFKALFFGAGNVCHVMLKYDTILTLNPDNPAAVEAVEAMYDCIYDVPQLHWILKPGNVWVQRAFSIGFFFVPFAIGIKNDMQTKRLERLQAKKDAFVREKNHIKVDMNSFGSAA